MDERKMLVALIHSLILRQGCVFFCIVVAGVVVVVVVAAVLSGVGVDAAIYLQQPHPTLGTTLIVVIN
jgi:hypothetical protein